VVLPIKRSSTLEELKGLLQKQDVESAFFANNVIGRKVSQWKKRQNNTDFDRFRVQKLLKRKDSFLTRERKIQQKKK